MALTPDDKEYIRLVIAEGQAALVNKITDSAIETHIKLCPHGQALQKNKSFLVGLVIGCNLTGGGLVLAAIKFLGG